MVKWPLTAGGGIKSATTGTKGGALESRNYFWHDGSPLDRINAEFRAKGTFIMSSENKRTVLQLGGNRTTGERIFPPDTAWKSAKMDSLCLAPIFEGKLRINYDRNDTTSPAYIREQPWEKTATKSDVKVPNYPLGAHDLRVRIWYFRTASMCRKYDQHMSISEFCGFISQIKRVIPHYQLLFVRVAATQT